MALSALWIELSSAIFAFNTNAASAKRQGFMFTLWLCYWMIVF